MGGEVINLTNKLTYQNNLTTINESLYISTTKILSPLINLTTCSSELDLIHLGPGGICVDCSTYFKVKFS